MDDYRESLSMVPGVRSFSDGVASIDLTAGGYTIRVTDEDNPLLAEDEEGDEEIIDE